MKSFLKYFISTLLIDMTLKCRQFCLKMFYIEKKRERIIKMVKYFESKFVIKSLNQL